MPRCELCPRDGHLTGGRVVQHTEVFPCHLCRVLLCVDHLDVYLLGYTYDTDTGQRVPVRRLICVACFSRQQNTHLMGSRDLTSQFTQLRRRALLDKQEKVAGLLARLVHLTAAGDKARKEAIESNASQCSLCQGGFSLFNHRSHCRVCGKAVCQKDSQLLGLGRFVSSATSEQSAKCCNVCATALHDHVDTNERKELMDRLALSHPQAAAHNALSRDAKGLSSAIEALTSAVASAEQTKDALLRQRLSARIAERGRNVQALVRRCQEQVKGLASGGGTMGAVTEVVWSNAQRHWNGRVSALVRRWRGVKLQYDRAR